MIPIRLLPSEVIAPCRSASVSDRFPATIVLRSVIVPLSLARPPPEVVPVLAVTVTLVKTASALNEAYNAPPSLALLLENVVLTASSVPVVVNRPPPKFPELLPAISDSVKVTEVPAVA